MSEEDIDYITNFDFNFSQASLCELEVTKVNTSMEMMNNSAPEPLCNLGSFKVSIFPIQDYKEYYVAKYLV